MRGILATSLLVLWLALPACESTPAERAASACSVICGCQEAPLPALQNKCVAQCTADVGGFNISDACVACISDHADRCAEIETDCDNVCTQGPPPVSDGSVPFPPPDAPIVVVDSF